MRDTYVFRDTVADVCQVIEARSYSDAMALLIECDGWHDAAHDPNVQHLAQAWAHRNDVGGALQDALMTLADALGSDGTREDAREIFDDHAYSYSGCDYWVINDLIAAIEQHAKKGLDR